MKDTVTMGDVMLMVQNDIDTLNLKQLQAIIDVIYPDTYEVVEGGDEDDGVSPFDNLP